MDTTLNNFTTWLGRYLLLILLGHQFRGAPLPVYGLLGMFIFYEVKGLRAPQHVTAEGVAPTEVSNGFDSFSWFQPAFHALLTLAVLDYQADDVRYVILAACAVLLTFTSIITRPYFWSQVLPFITTGPFWIVFFISAYYRYRKLRLPKNRQALQDTIARLIRTLRIAWWKEVGPSRRTVFAEVNKAQTDKAREWNERNRAQAKVEQTIDTSGELLNDFINTTRSPKYRRLPADGIRLLTLVETRDSQPGVMKFALEHTTLSAVKDQYTALSYCWGDSSRPRKIKIDDVMIEITANLYDALQEVIALGYKRLWIDAICINQKDIIERNSQVLRIFQVFQSAREVVAWLGREDDGSKQVMLELKGKTADGSSQSRTNSFSLDDLKRFMEQNFWRRIWIIQELAAARHVYLACCGQEARLDNLKPLIEETFAWEQISETNWPRFLEERQLIQNILDIRARRTDPSRPLSLLEALTKTKASVSTQLHDRVYGLLGLVIDQKYYVQEPNYKLSPEQLCRDMTLFWIRERGNLDIILAAPRHGPRRVLPSWCPDYLNAGTIPFNERLVRYISGHDKRPRLGENGYFWRTTGTTQAVQGTTFDLDGNTLRVNALFVGMINGVGPIRDRDDTSVHHTDTRGSVFRIRSRSETQLIQSPSVGSMSRSPRSDSSPGPVNNTHHSPYNAMCRLLLLYDPKFSRFTTDPIALGMLYHFLGFYKMYAAYHGGIAEEVQTWLDLNQDFKVQGRKLKDRAQGSAWRMSSNFVRGLFHPKSQTMMFTHYDYITKIVHEVIDEGMRLMTTQEGGLGWAHPEARPYDRIFLIEGCSLPVVLRETADHVDVYEIVGHAYVDGFMDGRKWEMGRDQVEKICIV